MRHRVVTEEQRERKRLQHAIYNAAHREEQRAYYYEHHERIRARALAYYAAHREERAAYYARWRETERGRAVKAANSAEERQRDVLQVKARNTLNMAVRLGKVERQPCEICGTTTRVHGHHAFGYGPDVALAVWWLCEQHHRGLHAALAAA